MLMNLSLFFLSFLNFSLLENITCKKTSLGL